MRHFAGDMTAGIFASISETSQANVNCKLPHYQAVGAQQAMARRGARLLYLPPYSPDLSTIEPCWSKVKTALRKAKARTREALDIAIADVMVTVSLADAWGWFKHGGYTLQ